MDRQSTAIFVVMLISVILTDCHHLDEGANEKDETSQIERSGNRVVQARGGALNLYGRKQMQARHLLEGEDSTNQHGNGGDSSNVHNTTIHTPNMSMNETSSHQRTVYSSPSAMIINESNYTSINKSEHWTVGSSPLPPGNNP